MISNLSITDEDFASLEAQRSSPDSNLRWDLVFTLPAWLRAWWQHFGPGAELYLRAVRQGNKTLGIAPLQVRDGKASIIGSPNVCDYQDFITSPGAEREFFEAVLDHLHTNGIKTLELESLRPDSSALQHLIPLARERGYDVDLTQSDVSLDMDLPRNWEDYLQSLDGKQRHELKRKMRNLEQASQSNYHTVEEKSAIPGAVADFLQLFPEARRDKADFMTAGMRAFFLSLAESLSEAGALRFGALEFAGKKTAMIMYFDYQNSVYLYNSAYLPEYKYLSVGIISKAHCIQDSIQKGKRKFDFLKGNEQYKYYLGGKEIPLYSCRINIP